MTRANAEQQKHTPWFAKAGAACSIVPISRFVGPNIFALKGGGYGCLFSLTGLDEEALTDLELEARVRQVEGASAWTAGGIMPLPVHARHVRLRSSPAEAVCERGYGDVRQRPPQPTWTRRRRSGASTSIGASRWSRRRPRPSSASRRRTRLTPRGCSRTLRRPRRLLEGHLGSSLGLRLLGKAEAFQFFSYLFNLEEWAGRDELRADTGVDRQIVNSPVAWHSDHVQIGKRHVQMFSLKTTPEASRPCLFSGLLTLDCDSVLCSTWRVKSASAARSEIDAQEKFISFFKVGVS